MSARSAFAKHGAKRKQKTFTSFTSFNGFDNERTTATASRMKQRALADVNAIVLDD